MHYRAKVNMLKPKVSNKLTNKKMQPSRNSFNIY